MSSTSAPLRPGLEHYEAFARIFDYPRASLPTDAREVLAILETHDPEAAEAMAAFVASLPGDGADLDEAQLDEMQELYTRSFQVQAVTTLDVGYVAFGDDYKRGELLVNLSREHREAGVDCGSELGDHLPNVLRLIPRWEDQETAHEFVELILYFALGRMIEEFDATRIEKRDTLYRKHYKCLIATSAQRSRMYRHALAALYHLVRHDYPFEDPARPELSSDFLANIGREMDIEARGAGRRPSTTMERRVAEGRQTTAGRRN